MSFKCFQHGWAVESSFRWNFTHRKCERELLCFTTTSGAHIFYGWTAHELPKSLQTVTVEKYTRERMQGRHSINQSIGECRSTNLLPLKFAFFNLWERQRGTRQITAVSTSTQRHVIYLSPCTSESKKLCFFGWRKMTAWLNSRQRIVNLANR